MAVDRRSLLFSAAIAVGLLAGLAVALPLRDVSDICPPAGEGFAYCALQKRWLHALVEVLAGGALGGALAMLSVRGRQLWAARRRDHALAGEPIAEHDPLLWAASWGRPRPHTVAERRRLTADAARVPRSAALDAASWNDARPAR